MIVFRLYEIGALRHLRTIDTLETDPECQTKQKTALSPGEARRARAEMPKKCSGFEEDT